MRPVPDPKTMAKALRTALRQRQIDISHAAALEIVAAQYGLESWNVLAAATRDAVPPRGIAFGPACPVMRIFDEAKAKEFYLGFLGFDLDWEHRFGAGFPLYAQLSRAGLALHLSEHHGDASPGSTVFVRTDGLRALHQELAHKAYACGKTGLEQQSWGLVMTVTDPFGNRIRFCQETAEA